MFERYTDKARRLIFFARFEASRYGSSSIETEHLLLGLVREDRPLAAVFMEQNGIEKIRTEIEQHITQRERISTAVELPLSTECKKVLNLASEEAQRLSHRHIGTEHILLGMLGVEGSLASRLLQARGLTAAAVREQVREHSQLTLNAKDRGRGGIVISTGSDLQHEHPGTTLHNFLDGLKSARSEDLTAFFSENAQLTDASGRRWDREEILKNPESLFAPYAKKNSVAVVETSWAGAGGLFIASLLWKNAILASEQRNWAHRMSVVLVREIADWRILLMHVTPVKLP